MALEGVQRRVQTAAGHTLVAILLGWVPLGGHQDVLGGDGVCGVWAGPGRPGGLSGTGALWGGRG